MLNRVRFSPGKLSPLAGVLTVVALLFAGWKLVQLGWLLAAGPVAEYPRLPPVQQTAAVSAFSGAWFGGQRAPAATAVAQRLPQARIGAQLLGVVLAGNDGVANIAHGRDRDGVYRVGDDIERGVRVEAIESRRVVLREQGELRQLDLVPLQGDRAAADEPPPVQVSTPAASGALQVGAGITTTTLPDGRMALQLDNAAVRRLSTEGVEPGEMVVEADGVPVSDLVADSERWQSLLGRDSVQVTLYRDGRSRQISVNPSAVAEQFLTGAMQGDK